MNVCRLILCCVFVACFCGAALAGELELSGIMRGARPSAIVNETIVVVGQEIAGYRVVEIGQDYVVFENKSGRVTQHLKEEEAKTVAKKPGLLSGATPVKKPPTPKAPAATPANRAPISDKAGKRLDRSFDNLKQADDLLKSKIKFDGLYVRVIALCTEAANEAQAAIKDIPDEESRRPVQDHLSKIRKVLVAVNRDKENLNTRVRTAIANQQIFPGMTSQNVISSWGPPLSKTNVGQVERWAYKDPNGYQRNLNFSNGVLVSF